MMDENLVPIRSTFFFVEFRRKQLKLRTLSDPSTTRDRSILLSYLQHCARQHHSNFRGPTPIRRIGSTRLRPPRGKQKPAEPRTHANAVPNPPRQLAPRPPVSGNPHGGARRRGQKDRRKRWPERTRAAWSWSGRAKYFGGETGRRAARRSFLTRLPAIAPTVRGRRAETIMARRRPMNTTTLALHTHQLFVAPV